MNLQKLYEEHKEGPISNDVLFLAIVFLDQRLKRKRATELGWRVFTLIVCFLLAWGLYTDWRQDQRVEKDRVERTVASCQQYNMSEQRQVEAEKAQILGLVNAMSPPESRTDETQVKVDKFLEEQNQLIEDTHPLRDCTTQGITNFLSTTTTQGN